MEPDLRQRVTAWLDADPDPGDRAELAALVDAGDEAELARRFAGTLAFGTAGLRGPLQAGPTGMSTAVVRRAAAGLAAHLGAGATLVVGHDARHRSETFARDVAAVAAGAGLRALLLPRALPTPVLAFAVRHLGADGGAMVTASHNPPRDNGLKVFLGGPGDDGAQIVPPADAEIEARIAAAPPASEVVLGEPELLGDDVLEAYLRATLALSLVPDRDVRLAYTPLHGVGLPVVAAALERAGFAPAAVVAEQAEPDPDFPTVAFPNPEEAGVMDRVVALGVEAGADVTLANDPDADRLCVAVGERVLTGDEVGVLLADHVLAHRPGLVATTLVSSGLLAELAAARGVPSARTLTGFKWLMRAGDGLAYAYEDALGYAVGPQVVHDKDGISALLAVAERAAELKARGTTLLDRLDELARELGLHATAQLSVRTEARAELEVMMERFRAHPPTSLAGRPVTIHRDLLRDEDCGALPASDLVLLEADGARVVVRPSGTEPKLKAYLEATEAVRDGDVTAARERAAATLATLRGEVATALGA